MIGFNLLPQKEKERILFEKKKKEIRFFVHSFLVILGIFSFFVFSLWEITKKETQSQKDILSQLKKMNFFKEYQKLQKEKEDLNKKIQKIYSLKKESIDFSFWIEKIIDLLPKGEIKINELHLILSEKNILDVKIYGFAKKREKVVEFEKNLKKEKSFSELEFPLSNYIFPEDVYFSFSFKIKKK